MDALHTDAVGAGVLRAPISPTTQHATFHPNFALIAVRQPNNTNDIETIVLDKRCNRSCHIYFHLSTQQRVKSERFFGVFLFIL